MNIDELLKSTIEMGYLDAYFHGRPENRRAPEFALKKQFGNIYWDNLVMAYKGDIIELTLVMGTATDIHKSAHRIAIALKGIDYDEVTETELTNLIKIKNPGLVDERKEDIISKVLEKNFQPLEGKTIVQKSTTEKKFFILPNKIDTSVQIAVKCTCSDFYYSWAWYNANHGCLIGKRPPAYKRVYTDDKNRFRTLRNPHKIPGMCKHVLLFLALLMKGGLIQNLPMLTSGVTTDIEKKKLKRLSSTGIGTLLSGLREELKDAGEIRTGFGN